MSRTKDVDRGDARRRLGKDRAGQLDFRLHYASHFQQLSYSTFQLATGP